MTYCHIAHNILVSWKCIPFWSYYISSAVVAVDTEADLIQPIVLVYQFIHDIECDDDRREDQANHCCVDIYYCIHIYIIHM